MSLGHRHPDITRAVSGQMNKIWFVAPAFNNTVDNAIKIARSHTRRKKILCGRNAWHGESMSTLPLSSLNTYFRVGCQPDVFFSEEETLHSMVKLIKAHPDAAAVLIDPLGVSIGLYNPATIKDNLFQIRDLCTEHGIILIFDEIQTFGGYMGDDLFTSGHFSLTPDIICIGKALGAGIPISATMCQGFLRAVVLQREGEYTYGGQPIGCVAGIQVIRTFEANRKEVSTNLAHFEKAAAKLQAHFKKSPLRIRQIGFFVAVARKDGKFAENWVKRVSQKSLQQGLLVRKNHSTNILIKPPITIAPDITDDCFEKFTTILEEVELEFNKPSFLYNDLAENCPKASYNLTRIRKKPPVASQWEYVGALLAEINPAWTVKNIDAAQQEVNVRLLRRVGIPAAEVYKSSEGYPEYMYQNGVSMDKYMESAVCDLEILNGLVLFYQRYVEMAHDADLSIPDRWPGNAIVKGMSMSLIDFDLTYQSTNDKGQLFAFEEVFSTFHCIAWIKNAELQEDLSNRLCLAVVDRYSPFIPTIWSGMIKFYSNPSKPSLPESLSHKDDVRAIEVMSKSFQNLEKV